MHLRTSFTSTRTGILSKSCRVIVQDKSKDVCTCSIGIYKICSESYLNTKRAVDYHYLIFFVCCLNYRSIHAAASFHGLFMINGHMYVQPCNYQKIHMYLVSYVPWPYYSHRIYLNMIWNQWNHYNLLFVLIMVWIITPIL